MLAVALASAVAVTNLYSLFYTISYDFSEPAVWERCAQLHHFADEKHNTQVLQ